MSYASQSGRARTSATSPEAFSVCQRCGFWYNRRILRNQVQWRGAALLPINIYVCPPCYDTPTEQLRAIVVPADPVPVYWPLVEPFVYDSSGNSPVIGEPTGLEQAAVMPLAIGPTGVPTHYGVKLPVVSVTANGTNLVAVTCSAPHSLSTNDQIAAEGLANRLAAGFFSVTVTTATAFTYQTLNNVPAGALATPTTLIVTALVGLPYNQPTIPQV